MKPFIAQIIYRIVCEGVNTEQYEEQWRLVFAGEYNQALEATKELAKGEECMFVDRHGRAVHWKLVAIKELKETTLAHGSLLLSAVREVTHIADPTWPEIN